MIGPDVLAPLWSTRLEVFAMPQHRAVPTVKFTNGNYLDKLYVFCHIIKIESSR